MAAGSDAPVRVTQLALRTVNHFAVLDHACGRIDVTSCLRPCAEQHAITQSQPQSSANATGHDALCRSSQQQRGKPSPLNASGELGAVTSACKHYANRQPRQHCCFALPGHKNGASLTALHCTAVAGLPSNARHLSCSAGPSAADVSDSVECVVIGAGVVGLAVARALALRGREVVVLDAAGAVGTQTSSRHSEVIHAGIYYPPGSLKARLCVEGNARLYDFCRTHRVPHKNIGKLIVATSKQQLSELAALRATAIASGVTDLEPLSAAEVRRLEPGLAPTTAGALLSPSTGILDSHTYMAALLADAEAHGAVLALNTRVAGGWLEPAPLAAAAASGSRQPHAAAAQTSVAAAAAEAPAPAAAAPTTSGSAHASPSPSPSRPRTPANGASPASPTAAAAGEVPYKVFELHCSVPPSAADSSSGPSTSSPDSSSSSTTAGDAGGSRVVEVSRLRARWVVNAAGLHAVALAAGVAGMPRSALPMLHLAKGNYFALSGRCPFSRLIYPLPERGLAGLGTHLTLDMGGSARFGPDVEWLEQPGTQPVSVDYQVDPRRADVFYPAIRRFYPALPDGSLQPAYSGVRPKLSGPGEPAADFLVQGARQGHGVRGWVNLFGIESPGLTSSLALAEYVCRVLESEG